ncbi:putative metal chaperone YciC [compost metagenome]
MSDFEISTTAKATPLTVLTGFLGAGKTTLLNRLLSEDHGLRIAVLVNDFGALNIDAELVVGVESDVVSLANGCVCCSVRDDLLQAIEQVLARPEQPEYVILEASGVADPAGIAITFANPALRERIRLDSIACVVDAAQLFEAPEQMELKLRQIAFADLLLLNKVDLVDAHHLARVRAWLDEHFHRYRLLETTRCVVPLEILLAAGRLDAVREPQLHEHSCDAHCSHAHEKACEQHHERQFSTWSFQSAQPLSLDAIRLAVARLPGHIYRCKGVLHCQETPDQRVILQVVGKRVDIAFGGSWQGQPAISRIVAIGAPGAIDAATLQDTFDACLV